MGKATMRRAAKAGCIAAILAIAACGKPEGQSAAQHWQMIDRYCTDCHNEAEYAGNVAFDRLSPESVPEHAEVWEKAIRKLRGRLMPPPNQPQPPEQERLAFITWLEDTLDAAAASRPTQRIGLHRLNRREYANAVRDLLGVNVDADALLPEDDKVHGFDNIASGLQVSPSFIEQYVAAARAVAVQAVGRPDARPGSRTYRAGPGMQHGHVAGLPLGTRGGMVVEHYFESDGEYRIDIADMATSIWGTQMEFENNLIVTIDGRLVYETVIGGDADMKLYDQVNDGGLDAVNSRLKNIRFLATAGPHKVGVTFRRRTFAESEDRRQMFVPGGGQDRVFRVSSFQISGPFDASGLSTTPSRERIFTCHPDRGDEPDRCAEQIITELASRAFRRPLAEADIGELLEYYREGVRAGGFEEGIRSALTGILASPFFLYRAERLPRGLEPGASYTVSDLELASKLSFFLWNTIPDDALRETAARGELRNPGVLRAQVERMLADPRAASLASNFVYQWLRLDRLDEIEPDRSIFPYASGSGDLREDFVQEVALFAHSIFAEDRSVMDLLTAKHTFVNERLALHYGIKNIKGDRFQRVELEHSPRWGLLGKGAILMSTAYPNRTSPVLRGAFILEHLLGTPPAAPPPNVEAVLDDDTSTRNARTVRELMAAHSTDPNCFSCHGVMDPLGFALENFDAVGAWRDRDRFAGGALLDTTGSLPDGTQLQGPDDLREALMRRPEQFVQTFTEALLTYALGRTIDYRDMPAVRRIVRDAKRDGYRFSAIVLGIIESDAFRTRRMPELPPSMTARAAVQP
jgi:hypothetical protein